jgi:glycosyltransferase involved in cell wall biosynthesis
MSKFSVLMSVYYKESPKNLEQSIISILNQTLIPNQIVIVKDGLLTQELDKVINQYEQKYKIIKIVHLKNNLGLGLALNEGIKQCAYDYIARMDSDDISVSNRFEKQIGYISQHPEIDVIGSNIDEYDEAMQQVISTRKVPSNQADIYRYIKSRNPFNHMSVIFKKKSVIDCGRYEDVPLFEDYYLWCKLAMVNGNFHNLPESLVKARASISMTKRRGGLNYIKKIYRFELKIYRLKMINGLQLVSNLINRIIFAIIPNNLRFNMYKMVLRGEK